MSAAVTRITREQARLASEKAQSTGQAPLLTHGNALLSIDDYWKQEQSKKACGVLEVNINAENAEEAVKILASSVYWGLPSIQEAETLATLANAIYGAYDKKRMRQRQFVAYSRPPCVIQVPNDQGMWVSLQVPANFAVLHKPEAAIELASLGKDHLVEVAKTDRASALEDTQLLHHFAKIINNAAQALPAAFFDAKAQACVLDIVNAEPRSNLETHQDDGDDDSEDDDALDPMDVDDMAASAATAKDEDEAEEKD